jgi:SAM-dependent methyltransferase
VKSFELAGYVTEGIEPGEGYQQFAQQRLRAKVKRASLFELPAHPTYDFVLLVHVIEHFNSPRRALTHIRGLLQPGGQLYIECPNLGAPHAAPGKQFHFAHVHNFTPDTLAMLAQSCGFELVARLSSARHRALRMVLRRVESSRLEIVPESYQRTREALVRYSLLGYHLRLGYWVDRLHRDARFVSHRILARQRLAWLVRRC